MIRPEGVADNTAPSWLERIAELERMLQFERNLRQAEARDMSVNEYLRSKGEVVDADPAQPSLFGEGTGDV